MQGLRLAAISDVKKTKLRRKICQSHWTVKYGSRSAGQGACLNGMSGTITMQGLRLTAIIDVEKTKLRRKHFPHCTSMGTICCHGNQSSDPTWPKT